MKKTKQGLLTSFYFEVHDLTQKESDKLKKDLIIFFKKMKVKVNFHKPTYNVDVRSSK